MSSRSLENILNLGQFTFSQSGLLVVPLREHVRVAQNPGSFGLLWRGELPLPRDEEKFILPPLIIGVLWLLLYESPPLSLEVVYSRASEIFMDSLQVQKFPYS